MNKKHSEKNKANWPFLQMSDSSVFNMCSVSHSAIFSVTLLKAVISSCFIQQGLPSPWINFIRITFSSTLLISS